MITKKQRGNALRIVDLADAFGHCPFSEYDQTVESVLNLSIPTARLVKAGVVTGVVDTNDGINDNAVAEVEDLCRRAVDHLTKLHGRGWWNETAGYLLDDPAYDKSKTA